MSQQNLSNDRAESGLPTADDYAPEKIGTAELSAGDPEMTFPQYGLEAVPILHHGEDTGRRFIRRNGNYVSDVSNEYQLLPNERVVEVANDVARELGAEPFHEFGGDWYVTLDDHVFQDPDRHRVHAVYAWEQGTVGGDDMEYGFGVHNSIDGSLAFSVGLFTFRHACANMVFLGTGGNREQRALDVESERAVVSATTHKHTKGLDVDKDALEATIKGTLTFVEDVQATYESWVERTLDPKEVAQLIDYATGSGSLSQKDIPQWMLDVAEDMDSVAANEDLDDRDELPWERRAKLIEASMPEAKPVWDTYNDLTENIWHGGKSGDQTRRRKMKETHRVLNPVEAGSSGVAVR